MISKPNLFKPIIRLALVFIIVSWLCPEILAQTYRKPKIVLIFDDFGYSEVSDATMQGFLNLDAVFTVSVIPGLLYSTEIASAFHRAGKEVILHLPMEAESYERQESFTLLLSMPLDMVAVIVLEALIDVPDVVGISNHQGSAFTQDSAAMNRLCDIIAGKGLYFIDSRTTQYSCAYDICSQRGIPALNRDVFLDCDMDSDETVLERFHLLVQLAEAKGFAVGIGHRFPQTLRAFEEFLQSPAADRVELVYPSQIFNIN